MGDMKRIVFTNDKGGVGKTTTVANLAVGLAKRGKKILVIDMDPQADVTFALLGQRVPESQDNYSPASIHSLLIGYHKITQVIVKSPRYKNLSLIPSNADLAGSALKLSHKPILLRNSLEELPKGKFDIVLIDTGKGLDPLVINALAAVQDVIIMVTPGRLELDAIDRIHEHVELVRERILDHAYEPVVRGILITLADPYSVTKDTIDRINKKYPGYLFKTRIPKNNDLQKAIGRTRSIFEVAPKSKGALAYEEVIKELDI